jgi:hypothetical protein
MTDVMSEAFGRELNARTTFEKEAVWLPLMAVHSLNGGSGVVRGKTFTECVIEGPALIAPMGTTTFDSCNLGSATDPKSLLFAPQGPVLVGAIGMDDCKFIRCTFVQVGFTGRPEFLEEINTMLLAARKAKG